jgi:hypothetical protein
MRLKKLISWAIGFVIVATVLVLVTTELVGANSVRLKVFPAPPPGPSVPVSVVNTPNVNSNITNASVPVTGSVAVTGTVGVNNFPSTQTVSFNGAAQPISFSNTSTTPIFNREADNPARNPVFGACGLIDVPGGGFQSCNFGFTTPSGTFSSVPAGNRLVIEFVSGELFVPSGTIPIEFEVRSTLGAGSGGGYTDVPFDLRFVGTGVSPGPDLWKVSQTTRIYEDPGSTVVLDVFTTAPSTSTIRAFVTVTGYLVSQ